MPEDTTGTPTGQTTGDDAPPQTDPQGSPPATPAGRTFTEAEVAEARRSEQRKAREAQEQAQALDARVKELEAAQAEWEEQRQAAEDAEKSEIQKALDRMQKAEAAKADADAARTKAERDARVASVIAERGVALPTIFHSLITGDDEETIGANLDAMMELGKTTFAPKSIGAANQPPHAAPIANPDDRNAYWNRYRELNDACARGEPNAAEELNKFIRQGQRPT